MKDVALQRFEWSVRALSQPAYIQLGLYPSNVCVADELALEFDEWRRRLFDSAAESEWVVPQIELIDALDKHLDGMSGPANEELWSDEALSMSSEWNTVRELASRIIRARNWREEPPPTERDTYIFGPG